MYTYTDMYGILLDILLSEGGEGGTVVGYRASVYNASYC